MKNNDFLKAPISASGQNSIKIDYGYNSKSRSGEVFGYIIAIFGIISISSTLIQDANKKGVENIGATIIELAIPTIFLAFFAVIAITFSRKTRENNQKKLEEIDEIVRNGKKLVGKVVKFESYTVGSGDSSRTLYYLVVEYENPEMGTKERIETPSFSKDIGIRNEDLPLDVTVYCYGNKVHVDEIVNPPTDKIRHRKNTNTLATIMMIVPFFIMAIAVMTGNETYIFGAFALFAVMMIFSMIIMYKNRVK